MSEKLRSATGALAPVLEKALFHHQKGQLAEAASLYQEILADNPNNADALHLSGVIEAQKKRPLAAIALIDRAIAVDSNNATFFSNRARVLRDLRRLDDAVSSYDHALAITPADSGALINRGNALQALKRYEDALASYDRALAIKPDSIEALNNRAIVLGELKHFDEALASYDRALAIAPDNAELHYNRGDVLRELKRLDEALVSYNRALAIAPDDVAVLTNRAIVLLELRHFDEALASYDRALTIMPDQDFLFGLRLFCKMNLCDWHGLAQDFDRLAARIESGKKAAPPFAVLPAPLSAPLQKACAEAYVREKYPKSSLLPAFERRYDHDRIRLGYFSSDFRNHPVGALTAGLFERHDRAKFEVIGFSLGPPTKDAMRARLEKSFDRFIEVDALSDKDVALLARRLEIDVAIDLNGLTTGSRTSIFALRAAPIQVSYLGYPGTMGAPYIDYLIADATLIPEDQQKHYVEKLAYLPDTYQVNDSKRFIADKQFARAECGLPEDGFVFCCFNNSHKIAPGVFDIWMRLLNKINGSVLWLSQSNNPTMRNLKGEAQARGIDPGRLVFAPFLPNPEHHLARLRLAGLFLDTLPYNAHATASDALWAGVPVLTCLGQTLPGRVAASLLNAVGLPELITKNHDQYEALALQLATKPRKILSLRRKLAANRLTQPLFDTARFAGHIESAFFTMWQRGQQGLAPGHIHVQPEVARQAERS